MVGDVEGDIERWLSVGGFCPCQAGLLSAVFLPVGRRSAPAAATLVADGGNCGAGNADRLGIVRRWSSIRPLPQRRRPE